MQADGDTFAGLNSTHTGHARAAGAVGDDGIAAREDGLRAGRIQRGGAGRQPFAQQGDLLVLLPFQTRSTVIDTLTQQSNLPRR